MEVDLTTSDDPPESHDQSQDDDTSLEHILPLELAHQLTVTASCNEHGDQDETAPEESGTDHVHTDSKAPGKQGAIFSGKILSFCCSECKDNTTYSPNDLLKHFQGAHKGTLPTYPCDLCSFVTNEFSALQRHRIGHRNTLVTCEICNDGAQYSLLWLTRHYTNCHSQNGYFRCKKCEFTTRDAGTFVQHMHHHNERNHKCVKSPHVSPTQGELQRHSGTFPFSCHICGYSAARKEYLSKHLTVVHGEEVDRTNKWRANEDNSGINSPGLKLLLKKNPPGGGSRDPQWMSKLNSFPGVGLLDQNGRLFNPEKTLEETQHFLERAVGVTKESNKWTKSPLKSEPQSLHIIPSTPPQPKLQEHESSAASGLLNPTNSNGLTVLMVKNKISIPPNCTTKVMGFKMVDGKKHLVLKVIPAKQEDSTENEICDSNLGEDEDKTTSSPSSSFSPIIGSFVSLESGESNETGAKTDLKPSIKEEPQEVENHTGNHLPLIEDKEVSPSAKINVDVPSTTSKDLTLSLYQSSQSNGKSSPHKVSLFSLSERSSSDEIHSENPSTTLSDSETPLSDSLMAEEKSTKDKAIVLASDMDEHSVSQLPADEITCSDAISHVKPDPEDDTSTRTNIQHSKMVSKSGNDNYLNDEDFKTCDNNTEQNAVIKSPVERNTICDLLAEDRQDSDIDKFHTSSEKTAVKTLSSFSLAGEHIRFPPNVKSCSSALNEMNLKSTKVTTSKSNFSPQHRISTGESEDDKDCSAEVENNSLNSPNQEVFSFHNYSKDTSGSSPDSLQHEADSPQMLEEEECGDDFGDWSLTLPASPPLPHEQDDDLQSSKHGEANSSDLVTESEEREFERVSDSDIEVDECIATVDDSLVPVLPEKERETDSSSVLDTKQEDVALGSDRVPANLHTASVLGKILEKHSDAIISQQLERERMRNSTTVQENVKPTKTTLRILQTPEGKQQMFLQTSENPYAVPVQLKSGAGFKLITKSCSPKINVSYVPGIETPNRTTGVAVTLNGGRIGMAAQNSSGVTKGQTSAQTTPGISGNRFFVNAASLKGPILLSGAVKSSSGDQSTNMPQTCYLVQRPVTQVNNESTGANSKTVLATRPVLAMPVKAADKTNTVQIGKQAYLVRYISPAKSGAHLNNSEGTALNQSNQGNEGGKNRVFLKILKGPNGARFLTTAPYNTGKKAVYLATSSLQSPCLLMSSHKSFTNASTGLQTSNASHKLIPAQLKHVVSPSNAQMKSRNDHNVALQKAPLTPCPTRPHSQRKRRRRALFEDIMESSSKTRRVSSKSSTEKDATSLWEPVAKDVERTLRLCPFSPLQEIKCPRRNQPVVVLNHPDADLPEVASIMRCVNKYKGDVVKVALSQSTVKGLSELNASNSHAAARPRPVGRTVAERFILKLKLKKTSRNKYEVVRSSSAGSEQQATFCCWFCGRVFSNQEDWIGHGQRHLMEATRDWNKLF